MEGMVKWIRQDGGGRVEKILKWRPQDGGGSVWPRALHVQACSSILILCGQASACLRKELEAAGVGAPGK